MLNNLITELKECTIDKEIVLTSLLFQNETSCLGQVAQLVGVSSHTPKCCGFDPWSGYIQEATS